MTFLGERRGAIIVLCMFLVFACACSSAYLFGRCLYVLHEENNGGKGESSAAAQRRAPDLVTRAQDHVRRVRERAKRAGGEVERELRAYVRAKKPRIRALVEFELAEAADQGVIRPFGVTRDTRVLFYGVQRRDLADADFSMRMHETLAEIAAEVGANMHFVQVCFAPGTHAAWSAFVPSVHQMALPCVVCKDVGELVANESEMRWKWAELFERLGRALNVEMSENMALIPYSADILYDWSRLVDSSFSA